MLGVSRLEVRNTLVRYAEAGKPRLHLLTSEANLHLQHVSGVFMAVGLGTAKALWSSDDEPMPDGFYVGNGLVTVGLRKAGYLYGGVVRHGAGIKVGAGVSPWTSKVDDGAAHLRELNVVSDYLPFRTFLFAHDRPIVSSIEGRLELIGCQAPFIRVRFDQITWRPTVDGQSRGTRDPVWVFPSSIAVGGYAWESVFLEVSAALELRTDRLEDPDLVREPTQDFGFSNTWSSRFRLYLEYEPVWLDYRAHLGAIVEAMPGSRNGWQFGLTLAFDVFGDQPGRSFE